MKPDNLVAHIKQLVAIPSTADNPEALYAAVDFIERLVLNSGKEITIERFESGGKPSLLAYMGTSRPDKFTVILNGHVDVVPGKPEQYTATIKDGKLYGRGVYDMKAACVVLTDVFCEYVDQVPYALGLQIVADEESAGAHGTLHQIEQGVRGDFIICGECGRAPGTYEIANEAKGIAVAELRLRGKAAHGAYPWRGVNAATKAAYFATKLHERYPTPSEATGDTTITITAITATSQAHTAIPDEALIKIDARYAAGDPHFATKATVLQLLQQIDPEIEIVQFHDFSAPLYTNPGSKLLHCLKASAEAVEGHPFVLATRHATSDGRFYGNVGNEACEFGLVGEYQHGDEENVALDALDMYHTTMRDFLERVSHALIVPKLTLHAHQPNEITVPANSHYT